MSVNGAYCDTMLTNVQRIRVYSLVVMLAIICVAVIFWIIDRQKLSDIRTLNQARSFSYALERYRQDFWKYPVARDKDIRKGIILSENGFAPGSRIYYQGGIPSSRVVSYQGNENAYAINFRLQKKWVHQGLTSTHCTITELYTLRCNE